MSVVAAADAADDAAAGEGVERGAERDRLIGEVAACWSTGPSIPAAWDTCRRRRALEGCRLSSRGNEHATGWAVRSIVHRQTWCLQAEHV